MRAFLAVLLVLLPAPALAQGFAGLGTTADGFETVRPGWDWTFPRDHGPHEAFRIEWWYVTANLEGEDGTPYGAQWTLFRTAIEPRGGDGWTTPQLWMGHAAITTPDAHYRTERLARGGVGQAGVGAEPFEAFIDEWSFRSVAGRGRDALDAAVLTARGPEFGYALDLSAQGPLVFHGQDGYSVKSEAGQASYYYSQPFYEVEGTLDLPSGPVAVTGRAWLDREFSSQPLAESQRGWDWFSLSFASGEKLMAFRLREDGGDTFGSASWIEPDGTLTPYGDDAISFEPLEEVMVEGRQVPIRWRVRLPVRGLDVRVSARNDQAWMGLLFPYWEGPVGVSGTHAGEGYLEMTGYDPE